MQPFIFCCVTALGFKPKTFSSVVRCSIQLSYAAVYFRVANIGIICFKPNPLISYFIPAFQIVATAFVKVGSFEAKRVRTKEQLLATTARLTASLPMNNGAASVLFYLWPITGIAQKLYKSIP